MQNSGKDKINKITVIEIDRENESIWSEFDGKFFIIKIVTVKI